MLCIEKNERKLMCIDTYMKISFSFVIPIHVNTFVSQSDMISSQEISSNIIHKKNNLRASYSITFQKKQHQLKQYAFIASHTTSRNGLSHFRPSRYIPPSGIMSQRM